MPDSSLRLIVFDLGGVMIRLADGWESACNFAGVPYRPFALTPDKRAEFSRLEHDFETGRISTAEFTCGVQHAGDMQYSPQEIAAVNLAIIREEFPGILAIVRKLKSAGYCTACLSNTCELHWPLLTDPVRYPAIGALDLHHASHLFGERKPDAAIYRCFEQATGMAPAEILFFDDRADNTRAARECGWHAVQVHPDRPAAEQISDALATHGAFVNR